MDRKQKIGSVLFIAVLIGYFIFQHSLKTTYQEVMSQFLGEDEMVESITVSTNLPLLSQTATTTINNQDLINSLLKQEIKLKRVIGTKQMVFDHTLLIQTKETTYTIGFDLDTIAIGDSEYYIAENFWNPIYILILDEDLEWEIGQ